MIARVLIFLLMVFAGEANAVKLWLQCDISKAYGGKVVLYFGLVDDDTLVKYDPNTSSFWDFKLKAKGDYFEREVLGRIPGASACCTSDSDHAKWSISRTTLEYEFYYFQGANRSGGSSSSTDTGQCQKISLPPNYKERQF